MLFRRCAWHQKYHGRSLVYGIASWRGLSVQYTHGICFSCARLAHAEFDLPLPVPDRSYREIALVLLAAIAALAPLVLETTASLEMPRPRTVVRVVGMAPRVVARNAEPPRRDIARRPRVHPAAIVHRVTHAPAPSSVAPSIVAGASLLGSASPVSYAARTTEEHAMFRFAGAPPPADRDAADRPSITAVPEEQNFAGRVALLDSDQELVQAP